MLIATHSVFAQDSTTCADRTFFWLNAGFGSSTFGLSQHLSVTCERRGWLLTARFVDMDEHHGLNLFPSALPWQSATEMAVLCGIADRDEGQHTSIALGLAWFHGMFRGAFLQEQSGLFATREYEAVRFHSLGLAINGQLSFAVWKYFGIGVEMIANVNTKKSFVATSLSVRIGDLY